MDKNFRSMVERSIQGILIIQDFRVVYANPALEKISGYSRRELLSLTPGQVEKMVHPDFRSLVWGRMRERLQGKKVVPRYEYKGYRKNGAVRWLEMMASRIEFEGKPAILGAIIDITERKEAEEALRESESRYLALFERSLYGVFLHDFEGRFIDANKAALSMLGYSKEDIPSLNFSSLLSDDQLPGAFKEMEEIIQNGYHKKPSVYRLRRKDGTFIWVETEATLLSKGGKPYAIQGIARDITEHKQAEEALKESEEKYRIIFESFHDVYYRTDREGLVTLISPSVRIHAGWEPEDIIGHPVTDFYKDPSEREIFKDKLKELGVINDYELQLLAKDGRVIDVSVSSKIIFDENGKPAGVEGVLRDITDRKRAAEQVKSSLREKEVLLQEIHHRVKNNMQIISSLLNLQSRQIEDEKVKDMFKMSRDRIRSMALIHEKLYLSKDLTRINFAQYIRSLCVHLMQTYDASSERIKLKADVTDVFLDINKAIPCGLIVNELLTNSLKHAFPARRRGNIHIELNTNNGNVCLGIRDDGIGFSKPVNFKALNSLGLQLVNDLVHQLGGHLKLEFNEGTSYELTFSA